MPNIWHICHTKHKNGVLSDVPNLKNYATLLQYRLKYETVLTTIAKSDNIILLCFSLSSSTDISLSVDSISFLLSLSLSISSLSSLFKKVAQDHSSPRRRSHRLMLQPSLPTFRSLLIWLWEWDLGWVSMWVLGRHCGCEIWDGFRCWCWCCYCCWSALMLSLL